MSRVVKDDSTHKNIHIFDQYDYHGYHKGHDYVSNTQRSEEMPVDPKVSGNMRDYQGYQGHQGYQGL